MFSFIKDRKIKKKILPTFCLVVVGQVEGQLIKVDYVAIRVSSLGHYVAWGLYLITLKFNQLILQVER